MPVHLGMLKKIHHASAWLAPMHIFFSQSLHANSNPLYFNRPSRTTRKLI